MTDIRIQVGTDGSGADFVLEDGDLVLDEGLSTPVLISLFSDARVEEEELDDPTDDDLRGWWGEDTGDPWGSKLWLLDHAKQTVQTEQQAAEFAQLGLAWLLSEGIAKSVEAQGSALRDGQLFLAVQIAKAETPNWEALWTATEAETFNTETVELRLLLA